MKDKKAMEMNTLKVTIINEQTGKLVFAKDGVETIMMQATFDETEKGFASTIMLHGSISGAIYSTFLDKLNEQMPKIVKGYEGKKILDNLAGLFARNIGIDHNSEDDEEPDSEEPDWNEVKE